MAMLRVNTTVMSDQVAELQTLLQRLEDISSDVAAVNQQLQWRTSLSTAIRSNLSQHSEYVGQLREIASALSGALSTAVEQYTSTENELVGVAEATASSIAESVSAVIAGGDGDDGAGVESFLGLLNEEDEDFLDKIKSILKAMDKWGDNSEAGILENILSYLEDFESFFFGSDSDKAGLTGLAAICSLADSSVSVWTGLYDYWRDMFEGVTTGLFGDIANRNVKILGLSGSLMGLVSSVLSASETLSENIDANKWGTIIADYLDCGKDVISTIKSGYTLKHIKDVASLADVKAGVWSALSVYTAIGEAGVSTVSQAFRSIEKYASDGSWDVGDTGATGIDISVAGIYGLSHSLTLGLDDLIFGWVDKMSGGDENDDLSYAEKAAEGYKIMAEKAGEAIGSAVNKVISWFS